MLGGCCCFYLFHPELTTTLKGMLLKDDLNKPQHVNFNICSVRKGATLGYNNNNLDHNGSF